MLSRLLLGNGRLIARRGPFYFGYGSFTWWVATLFMVGSFLFAAGTVIAVSDAPEAAGIVYFVGSIFFTTAGYGQFLSALNAGQFEHPSWLGRRRSSVDWRASAIQSFGTLCFNVSTGFALVSTLTNEQMNRLIWSPDVFGSIAFLWSSWLAFAAVRASWLGHPRRGATWASAALNLLGSIFFGISAVGAFVIPQTGELLNVLAANAGTFLGAVCFFIGAWLIWPEAEKLAVEERRA
jgi:hypothetical protein